RPAVLAFMMLVATPDDGQTSDSSSGAAARSASDVATPAAADPATLAEYNARKQQLRRSAESHMALAQWCQEHGLRTEAEIHAAEAIELDPRKEAPWRLLGFQKVNGRWLTADQAREEAEQAKADREWAPKLTALHRALHGPRKKTKPAVHQQTWEAL